MHHRDHHKTKLMTKRLNRLVSFLSRRNYLVLNEGVDSLQHPLTGELVGQVGLNLITQTQGGQRSVSHAVCVCVCVCVSRPSESHRPPPTLIQGNFKRRGPTTEAVVVKPSHSTLPPRLCMRGRKMRRKRRRRRAKTKPGGLQLATDRRTFEALQTRPVNKAIVLSPEHNTRSGL